MATLKRGVREATTDIIVTFDTDGEHRPDDIKKLTRSIAADKLDLVLGAR
ncbi:glycosyltransferase [Halorubrum ezzemoulense]|nr:glycosyltransferase [Halorubrum ezzemoulense]MDB2265875.1 glycosyltransferase [Halorubrum ezzemoulense]